jgi:hypothetical protein
LLLSFAQTVQVQVATQFFMSCRTAASVLTAVLTVLVCCQKSLNMAPIPQPSEGNNAEERGQPLQDHCGTAYTMVYT